MKTRPILFNGPMVRALLDGSKTQTRRVVTLPHQNPLGLWESFDWGGPNGGRTAQGETVPFQQVIAHTRTGEIISCPYGQPGDQLWVRETFVRGWPNIDGNPDQFDEDGHEKPERTWYRATNPDLRWDCGDGSVNTPWKPSIHMPHWACRITLEITAVRVERLQDINDEDSLEEGVYPMGTGLYPGSPRAAYQKLWESINGPGSWSANPWVWAIEFKRITP